MASVISHPAVPLALAVALGPNRVSSALAAVTCNNEPSLDGATNHCKNSQKTPDILFRSQWGHTAYYQLSRVANEPWDALSGGGASGSQRVKVVPSLSPLETVIEPPCCSTICRAIARPTPVPE